MTTNLKPTPTSTALVTAIFLIMAVGLYLFFDRYLAVSLLILPTLAYCGFWAVIGFFLLYTKSVSYKLFVLLTLLALILPVRFINWDSRKPFLKDLYQIEVGMTEAQVEQIMGNYIKGSGWPASPNPEASQPGELTLPQATIYRHTTMGWGDSDWGMVTYQDGQVVAIDFSPD